MPPNDRQQATTKQTARFGGDTPVILRIIRRDVAGCKLPKTLFMAPDNKLIVSVPGQVNLYQNRRTACHCAVSKAA